MNENDLAAQLLKRAAEQGISSADAAAHIAGYVIQKDRRRIRALSAATIGLWLIAALLVTTILLPMLAQVNQHVNRLAPEIAKQDAANPGQPPTTAVAYKLIMALAMVSTVVAAVTTTASLVGAICTVWLV